MSGHATPTLNETTQNWKAGAFAQVEQRHEPGDVLPRHHLRIYALHLDRVRPALEHVHLVRIVGERQHTTLTEHDVVVELFPEPLIHAEGVLEEVGALGEEIIRANRSGISPGVSTAQPTLLQHRDILDAVATGQVVGGSQALTTTTDDHDVVSLLRLD
ncbi:hypothetical protein D9M69_600320 [compost metagenome]